MFGNIFLQISNTLSKKPEYGIASSMLSITMSTTDILQFIGIVLGLFIAGVTAVLKVMELRDKLRERNRGGEE
jgi:MFS superfamily sulfate permease-like transporter